MLDRRSQESPTKDLSSNDDASRTIPDTVFGTGFAPSASAHGRFGPSTSRRRNVKSLVCTSLAAFLLSACGSEGRGPDAELAGGGMDYMENDSSIVTVPIEGLAGPCCETIVLRAFSKIAHVRKVSVARDALLHRMRFTLENGHGLPLTSIESALTEANTHLKDHLGVRYRVAKSLDLTQVHLFRTGRRGQGDLERALKTVPGFRSVRIYEGGFAPCFVGMDLPSVGRVKEAVSKEAGFGVVDLILAPSQDGTRYACPLHPDKAQAAPGRCPICNMNLETLAASVQTPG
jgi:hypothetical protein